MKNKNIKTTIGLLAIILIQFGCSKQLDLAPLSEVGDNGYYQNGEQIEEAVIAIYDGMQEIPLREFALTEMRSDNAESKNQEGDWAQFQSYTVEPTNLAVGSYWLANYNVIFRANKVIENLDVVESADDKAQFEGEALFARAMAHFNLVRAYGDVPLIDKVVIQTDEDYFSRVESSEVLAAIDADLASAATLLPASNSFGRATSGAANALLGKVRLTTKDYAGAKAALNEVTAYGLESNYRDVFYNEGNSEVIFAIRYSDDDANESQDFSYEMTALGVRAGLNYITADFTADLDTNELARKDVIYSPTNERECGKYLTQSSDNRLCGNDWIVIRYADVLLMRAEAIMGAADQTADQGAINSYNEVRQRAGMSVISAPDVLTKQALSEERRVELSYENHRFYDLVRFGYAQSVLTQHASNTGVNFSPTDLLLPIPQAEINVSNGKLTQNPGY